MSITNSKTVYFTIVIPLSFSVSITEMLDIDRILGDAGWVLALLCLPGKVWSSIGGKQFGGV